MDYLVGLDALSIGELLPLAARGPHEEQVPTCFIHKFTNLRIGGMKILTLISGIVMCLI